MGNQLLLLSLLSIGRTVHPGLKGLQQKRVWYTTSQSISVNERPYY